MISFQPNAGNTLRFSGLNNRRRPAAWLEDRLNAMHPATDKFEKLETIKTEKLDVMLDRLLGKFKGRQAKKALREAEESLIQTLNDTGLSKNGGLSSAYWQAFHLPEALFRSALGDTTPSKEQFLQYAEFVQEVYTPLIQKVDNDRNWWTLDWVLKGLQGSFASGQTDQNIAQLTQTVQTLNTLLEERSPFWAALQGTMESAHKRFNESFYRNATIEFVGADHQKPLPATRDHAYVNERNQLVQNTLLPWLQVMSGFPADKQRSDMTQDFADNLLPALLDAFSKTNEAPGIIFTDESGSRGEPEASATFQRELLLLLWRVTSLQADLEQVPCDFSPLRQAFETLPEERVQTASIKEGGPPIYLTHDDVLNTIPPEMDLK